MSKILYKNCQKYLPSKSRLWGQILFWKTHQNPTLQNCQNFQELSKIVKNIGYMMPSFGGWMFLLDICCQLLEEICNFEGFCGPFGPRVGENMQFWGFLLGESTYFIGFMLPTFGIICKLGGFCGPFGPRVGKFAFFDIILLKLKYLPSMSCDIEGRRLWGQIFVMYSVHYKYLPSKSSALKVVCPQSRLPSKSWAQCRCPQCRLPSMSHRAINQNVQYLL